MEVFGEKLENNNVRDQKTKSLESIVKVMEQPNSQNIPCADSTRKMAMHDAVTDNVSQSLPFMSSGDTFRRALVQTFKRIETKRGVSQVTKTLPPELKGRASDNAFCWVLCRSATP